MSFQISKFLGVTATGETADWSILRFGFEPINQYENILN